jgi:hypothetical protein
MPIGSIISGLFGANAASQQVAAEKSAINLQGQEFAQTQQNLLPFLQTGTTANSILATLFGVNGQNGTYNPGASFNQPISSIVGQPPSPTNPQLVSQFQSSPGYNYQLQQMMNAVQNSAAGQTGAVSGNMLQALQTNASGLANQNWNQFYNNLVQTYGQQYSDAFNNRNQMIAALSGLGSQGQNAAVAQGGFGQSAVQNIGNLLGTQGSAQAAGTAGLGNSLGSALSGITGNSSTGGGNNSILNYLFGNGGGGNFSAATAAGLTGTDFYSMFGGM